MNAFWSVIDSMLHEIASDVLTNQPNDSRVAQLLNMQHNKNKPPDCKTQVCHRKQKQNIQENFLLDFKVKAEFSLFSTEHH